jgi:hypothetical protein
MTSDRDYLGKGNIDRFDALYFHAFFVNTDDKGKKQDLKGFQSHTVHTQCVELKLSWRFYVHASTLIYILIIKVLNNF